MLGVRLRGSEKGRKGVALLGNCFSAPRVRGAYRSGRRGCSFAACFGKGIEEEGFFVVVEEDGFAAIAARHDVVKGTGELDTDLSGNEEMEGCGRTHSIPVS